MDDGRSSDVVQAALRALGRLPPSTPLPVDALSLVLVPREPGLQDKTVNVGQLAAKMVSMRNKLRVLEQRVNASDIGIDEKLQLEALITQTYDAFSGLMAFFSADALPLADEDDVGAGEGTGA
jgi:hypothetical protein